MRLKSNFVYKLSTPKKTKKIAKQKKEYYNKNKIALTAKQKEWNKNNKDKIRANQKLKESNPEIIEYLDSFEKDSKALKQELLKICWYMRGSISYEDAVFLSYNDREMINKIIKDNLETTKESGLPFF